MAYSCYSPRMQQAITPVRARMYSLILCISQAIVANRAMHVWAHRRQAPAGGVLSWSQRHRILIFERITQESPSPRMHLKGQQYH
jgi:hypothetical protein